jgi:murein DD-endopeptidase MepM/ murein hydrolase activator NlpD
MPFPLPFVPALSYRSGGRKFGAHRSNGRIHAGSDLIAPVGTPIFAVADGIVLFEPRDFYRGTWAMAINHFGYVARYCEFVKPSLMELRSLQRGAPVQAGQVIAHVGKMFHDSMLHFELYTGKLHGELTDRKNKPYQRRADLINSAVLLDRLRNFVQMSHQPIALQGMEAR